MSVSYEKLWKLMKDNKLKKKDLVKAAGVSSYAMAKLNREQLVPMEIMVKFCKIFHCDIGDVMEVIEDD